MSDRWDAARGPRDEPWRECSVEKEVHSTCGVHSGPRESTNGGTVARRTNYGFEKRQRELRKQKRKEEKAERKAREAAEGQTPEGAEATEAAAATEAAEETPPESEPPDID